MGKLFCIIGKSASGKDTIFKKLTEDKSLNLKKVVLYTTRSMRIDEIEGRDYFFVSDDVYERMRDNHQIIECRTYNTVNGIWRYFTADDGQIEFSSGNLIMIGTLEAYIKLKQYFGEKKVVPVYIETEDGLRLERALAREKKQKNPNYAEVCRRFLADREDFSESKLETAGITCRYENIDMDICYEQIYKDIKKTLCIHNSTRHQE